jgi:hypothetical protein
MTTIVYVRIAVLLKFAALPIESFERVGCVWFRVIGKGPPTATKKLVLLQSNKSPALSVG